MSDATTLPASTKSERIEKALAIAVAYGGLEDVHHKDWVIDQMVRALTSCPMEIEHAPSSQGEEGYSFTIQGESQDYKSLVAQACDGEDGPQTYSWETGIAP